MPTATGFGPKPAKTGGAAVAQVPEELYPTKVPKATTPAAPGFSGPAPTPMTASPSSPVTSGVAPTPQATTSTANPTPAVTAAPSTMGGPVTPQNAQTGAPITTTTTPPVTPNVAPTPATGSVPSAGVTAFGPENDLRFQQITPTAGLNRQDETKKYFDSLVASSQPDFDRTIRAITQRAAASGTLGSGMYGSNLVDAATDRNRDLTSKAAGLAFDTVGGTINDATGARNELRGERDYQTDMDRRAQDDAIAQVRLQEELQGKDFAQQQQLLEMLARLGWSGDPSQLLLGGANEFQGQANSAYDSAGASLSALLQALGG